GHRHEEFAPATDDSSFGRDRAAPLVVAEANDDFRWRVEQPGVRWLLIESEKRLQRRGCVEIADRPGNRLLLPDVQVPDNFTVARVEERHAAAIPVAGSLERAFRVTLGLLQHVLRIYRDF